MKDMGHLGSGHIIGKPEKRQEDLRLPSLLLPSSSLPPHLSTQNREGIYLAGSSHSSVKHLPFNLALPTSTRSSQEISPSAGALTHTEGKGDMPVVGIREEESFLCCLTQEQPGFSIFPC